MIIPTIYLLQWISVRLSVSDEISRRILSLRQCSKLLLILSVNYFVNDHPYKILVRMEYNESLNKPQNS
jgi:hypothetical protein